MNLSRWMLAIGVLVGLGCLQVAQRNALYLKGYAVGDRTHQVHVARRDVLWLKAEVTGLESPAHLARVAEERRLKLVAWSTLAPSFGLGKPAVADAPARPPVTIASADAVD